MEMVMENRGQRISRGERLRVIGIGKLRKIITNCIYWGDRSKYLCRSLQLPLRHQAAAGLSLILMVEPAE